jgi:hypothetical protein
MKIFVAMFQLFEWLAGINNFLLRSAAAFICVGLATMALHICVAGALYIVMGCFPDMLLLSGALGTGLGCGIFAAIMHGLRVQ